MADNPQLWSVPERGSGRAFTQMWGERAVVIGASIAGLSAAAALRRHFGHVLIVERDVLPLGAEERPSVPQARHVHSLLAGGLHALEQLFPGLTLELASAGAERLDIDLDRRIERPQFDPFPARDCGFFSFSAKQSWLESRLRARVRAFENVAIADGCSVQQIETSGDRVRGVRWQSGRCAILPAGYSKPWQTETVACDLVVDCSGRPGLTLRCLSELGLPAPSESVVGVDLGFTSASFEPPSDSSRAWKVAVTLPHAPRGSRFGMIAPDESGLWFVSLAGRGAEKPTADAHAFLSSVRALRTPTLQQALRGATLVAPPASCEFPASRRHHFEAMPALPKRLLVMGDASCRVNPIYGQGMTVAAQQAAALATCLQSRNLEGDPWDALGRTFVDAASAIVSEAWNMSAIHDLTYPDVSGPRPHDLRERLTRAAAFLRLAAEDAEFHRLLARVEHMLDRPSVLRRHEFMRRALRIMERGLGRAIATPATEAEGR